MKITGAQLLVEALKKENTQFVFGYTGAAVIPIFDCLYNQDSIKVVVPRHEQGLVHAADGYARATGKPGICLVTSGPGATNTITGLATAYYDSVPIVCFTGQVPLNLIGNDAFQEADIIGMSRSVTKHSFMVTKREEMGAIIKKAFYIATSGRPGPVVVDLPSNIIKETGSSIYPDEIEIRGYKPVINGHTGQIKKAVELIKKSRMPLFLAGGGIKISKAGEIFYKAVEKTGIPVVATLQGLGSISTQHPLFIGMLGMHGTYAANKAVSECDVLISVGTRFSDRITGKLSEFAPNAKIIHIDIDSAAISRNVPVHIPIVGDARLILYEIEPQLTFCECSEWIKRVNGLKESNPLLSVNGKERISPMEAVKAICEEFDDAIITTDVGQHQMWTAQFGTFKKPGSLITSGGLGTMGFGLPAAIGAQMGNIHKKVVCISGDGGFQMNVQELATAVLNELPLICIIFNNEYLGMVRQWQGFFYDKRYSGTCMKRRRDCPLQCDGQIVSCPVYIPDFIKLAEAYGVKGIRVLKKEDLRTALKMANDYKKGPVLIELLIERESNVLPMVPSGAATTQMITEGVI